jgi:hypothetical protein
MWGPGSTVFGEYRGIESIIQPPYLPLAWRGERDGGGIFEHRSVRIIGEGRVWCSNHSEGAEHKNRRSVGKSTWRLFGGNS